MSRIDELKAQIAQLDDLLASGALSAEAAREARHTLEQQLVAQVMQGVGAAAPNPVPVPAPASGVGDPLGAPVSPPAAPELARPSRGLIGGLAAFVLVFSAAGYAWLGNRAGLKVEPGEAAAQVADAASGPVTAEQIEAMLERLAQRLKQQPDDVEGWMMLGRSYSILGRFPDAVPAFRRVVALRPQDAQAHADLADALGSAAGGSLQGEPEQLIGQALSLDPRNLKALALAGSVAFGRGDAPEAVRQWEKALAQAEPGGEMAQQLQGVLEEARRRAGQPAGAASAAAAAPATAPAAAPTQAAAPAAAASAVQGRITLAASLRGRVAPDDTLYVFARPAQGAKMPLAILRKQVRDLPLEFTLDDSLAMSPAARLSSAGQVIVGARISKSGNAMPQPGDLQGLSGPVAVGSRGVQLEIADVLP